jgi:FkbM family methyltransferase
VNFLHPLPFILNHPLNRDGRIGALARFVRWQVASRIIRRPIALPFIDSTLLLTSQGMTGATGNYYCGLHEVTEMAFVLHALRADDLFVDVGANVGSYTVLAGGAVGAEVIAVEPLPATFARLESNIRLNGIGARVVAHCCGLSSEAGELQFVSSLDTMNRVALPGETLPTITSSVLTLDELCRDRCPTIVKMDVEGHEHAVLGGSQAILANPGLKAVLMETNESGAKFGVSDQTLFDIMSKAGFTPCEYDPFGRRLNLLRGSQKNTVFVRDPEGLSEICAAAAQFTLVNGAI